MSPRPRLAPLDRAGIRGLRLRADKARARLARYTALLSDVHRYAMPERDTLGGHAEGQERSQHIYDSTAVTGTSRFANELVQAMFPPQQRWARLARAEHFVPASEDEAQELDAELARATEVIFTHLRQSNFDTAIVEAAHDLAGGTMVLLVESGQAGGRWGAPLVRVQAVPVGAVALEDGPFGTVEAVFHDLRLAGRLVQRMFPDARLPDRLARQIAARPETEVGLTHCVTFEPAAAAWRMAVLAGDDVLVERAYRTNPWIVVRWLRAPGEVYGRGPLTQTLPDIRTVNKAKELTLQNAALAIAGVYTAADDGVLNPYTVRIEPGAVIPVRSNGGPLGPSLSVLQRSGAFDLSQFVIDDLQRPIRAALFDKPLPPEIRSNVSAFEIAQRMSQYARDTGAFGRLNADGVGPLMLRLVDILDEAGVLPGVLRHLLDDRVRVLPTSPLALLQDLADVNAVTQFMQLAAGLEPFAPGALRAALSVERTAPWLARKLAVPPELLTTAEERREAQAQAAEAQAAELLATSPVAARVAANLTDPRLQQREQP